MEEYKKILKRRTSTIMILLVIITFAVSLYVVEWSSIGSQSLGQYNNGYGTFDMKSYSVESVSNVLGQMQPEGFGVYKKYFVADYFFVLTFGTLQMILLNIAYKWIYFLFVKRIARFHITSKMYGPTIAILSK